MKKTAKYLFLLSLGYCACTGAAVYKSVDKDGNVIYSDVPEKKDQKPIKVEEPMTFESQPARRTTAESRSESGEESGRKAKPAPTDYESLAITQPGPDQAIRSNSGDITVQVSASPVLQKDHVYVIYVDGSKVHEGTANSVNLTNQSRGSHTISAEVRDEQGNVLISSGSMTFHLLRHSVLH
jgi:hypothetical protein